MSKGSNRSSKRMRGKIPFSIPSIAKLGNFGKNSSPCPKRKATRMNYDEHEVKEIENNVKTDNIEEDNPLPSKVSNIFQNAIPNLGNLKNVEYDTIISLVKMDIRNKFNQIDNVAEDQEPRNN